MFRSRLSTLALATGLGLVCGCTSCGEFSLFSWRHGPCAPGCGAGAACCDGPGPCGPGCGAACCEGPAACCDGPAGCCDGPVLGPPAGVVPPPPPEAGIPPMGPMPRLVPQAQTYPYSPTSAPRLLGRLDR